MEVGSGFIALNSGKKNVKYSVSKGRAFFEGDICLGPVENIEKTAAPCDNVPQQPEHGIGISGNQYRWPRGRIPYEIDANVAANTRTFISNAIAHWHENTPIRLMPRNGEANYVRFIDEDGCWSYVGMVGGRPVPMPKYGGPTAVNSSFESLRLVFGIGPVPHNGIR